VSGVGKAVAVAAIALAACSTGGPPNQSGPPSQGSGSVELTVLAAASLAAALEEAATAYETEHPEATLTLSTDSSAALRTQIEQGAPADVFLSADTTNPDKLVEAGLVAGSPVAFAGNLLTIVVPEGNPAGISTPADLAREGVRIVAAGEEVPITRYATQTVDLLAGLPGYPAGFAAAYAANVVSREDNVTAIVAKLELGEGDAGIVYVTDARATDRVEQVTIPGEANAPATYAGVVLRSSSHGEAAAEFLAWLAGPRGQAILADFGFTPPPPKT